MAKKPKNLSHEEIWDDSVLVDSWNEAYEEYKYYHGLHARGEKVKDVLDAYERGEDVPSSSNIKADQNGVNATEGLVPEVLPSEDGEIGEEEADEMETEVKNETAQSPKVHQSRTQVDDGGQSTSKNSSNDASAAATAAVATAFPESAARSQDPALKNLMMSWYWAGYYTGLHEGQNQSVIDEKTPQALQPED